LNDEERSAYVFGVNPPEPKVPKNIFSSSLNLTHIDEVEIARQLTLIEFEIFSQIAPTELLNRAWCDPDKRHKSPHIISLLSRFTTIANWVTATIVSVIDNKRNRARMIEKYIKIAENLKQLKNFQTLFAVLTGLNSSVVTRLNQTFLEIAPRSRETLNDLMQIISREENYKNYREFLRYSALPCLPFGDVILKDLLAIEDTHPDHINNLVNFQKRQLLYRAITGIQGYQQRPFNLQPVHQIATFLSNFPIKEEKELYELSYKCEPKVGK